jgi:hypothetical protein
MVGWMGIAVIGLVTVMVSTPVEATYILNCRLMDSDAPIRWRQGCKWETVITECKPGEPCKVKRQNFISLSAKAVINANVRLRSAVLVSGATSEAASLGAAMSSPGLASSSRTTGVGSTVSGTIGGAAGTVTGVVSGATGTADRAVSGLVP